MGMIEDEYYASQGVRNGSAWNEYLVSVNEQNKQRERNVQHRVARTSSHSKASNPEAAQEILVLGILGVIGWGAWWLWMQMENYALLSFPYNIVAEYYNYILREPLLFLGSIAWDIILTAWNHDFTRDEVYDFIIGVLLCGLFAFLVLFALAYTVASAYKLARRNKVARIGLWSVIAAYMVPASLTLVYFIVMLFVN